ncbi:NAD(P)H:quinone oxidoreductase [Quadrisphaera sp. DSM 44207]|uniref:NAD(P)H:quinone oxidoreductase n=1 Tax=Quadrisphaera sp. DSM 44207 TaxID=1881057 RepID=UPI00087ECEFE|nr:NAD(P)H:quinone oxidoreductase [Quadrisphaera sp. DSM 44207]SDQ10915.1 NAD(P)H dehydrogenase (quinone) [Quadrisphaera sp. DSM 44207]
MADQLTVSIIYYSATGSVHRLARAVAEAAEAEGAQVRLRKVHELAPEEAIASNQGWAAHRQETQDVPEASLEDLEVADAVLFGTPTRYGLPAAQLKQFIDTTGGLWAQGKLADKVYSSFTSIGTAHGGHESTLLSLNNVIAHWGGILVAPGYTDPIQFQAGNPYGTSHTSNNGATPPGEVELAAAAYQARRVVRIARALKAGLARVSTDADSPEQAAEEAGVGGVSARS